jgi:hypothetical protein
VLPADRSSSYFLTFSASLRSLMLRIIPSLPELQSRLFWDPFLQKTLMTVRVRHNTHKIRLEVTDFHCSVVTGESIASEGKGDYLYVHGRILDTKVSKKRNSDRAGLEGFSDKAFFG